MNTTLFTTRDVLSVKTLNMTDPTIETDCFPLTYLPQNIYYHTCGPALNKLFTQLESNLDKTTRFINIK